MNGIFILKLDFSKNGSLFVNRLAIAGANEVQTTTTTKYTKEKEMHYK